MIRDIYIKGYSGSTPPPPPPAGWTRPADWLTMPDIKTTDDTFVSLHAVFPSGNNFAAFRFTTSTGQYQVDWGDGVVDLVNSNVVAEHTYDYATYDTVNATLSTRGYKQAIITVTPVTGNLLTCSFNFRRTTVPAQTAAYATGFLDCILSMPNASSGQSIIFSGLNVTNRYCEQFEIKNSGGCTNMTNMFFRCTSLQSIPYLETSSVTNMTSMFDSCSALQTVSLFNTASVTNFTSMFASSTSLKNIPLFNTANVTVMNSMFQSCISLQTVPLFNTANVTSMQAMFNGCVTIQEIPAFNTSLVLNLTNLVLNCNNLDRSDIICPVSVVFQNCQISQSELVNIFNNLVDRTLLTAANINITGNWGASALTVPERAIATLKNWTITG
jgi:surface protein